MYADAFDLFVFDAPLSSVNLPKTSFWQIKIPELYGSSGIVF